jgi:hypothetical protein
MIFTKKKLLARGLIFSAEASFFYLSLLLRASIIHQDYLTIPVCFFCQVIEAAVQCG